MPIYEYQCQACKHEFEAIQKMSDAALTDCPQCHTPSLRKKISAAGFRLAGSGWYETDFKKSGNKKNLAGDGQSTSDSKPDSGAAKTETAAPAKDTKASSAPPAAST